ncbi:MAG: putrescine transport system substrate-binding protein [Halieaceae bacterium]|jgi:putrescine transport system substrate-binding protein
MRLIAGVACLVFLLPPTGWAADAPLLNIYNWSDYIDPEIITEFEQEFGIDVNYDIYDSSAIVDTKLLTGSSGYDVILHAASNSASIMAAGVYQAVDFSRLENWHHIDADIVAAVERNYQQKLIGVPYMWGTTGFTYNVDLVKARMADAPINSAAMLFDPAVVSKFADCGVTLIDDADTNITMALAYLGLPPNSVEPAHLAQAETLLKAVRPYIKYFSSTKMMLDLPSEEVCIAGSWSGDYSIASSRAAEAGLDINLAYTVPREGAPDFHDVFYIPSDASHPDNAHLFLDFILRPEIVARASNFVGYANVNRSATPLVDQAITSNPAIYPNTDTLQRLYSIKPLSPKLQRLRTRIWTKVKSGL